MRLTYKGQPAEILKHFRGRHLLRYQPKRYEPWQQVAQGSRGYLLSLCERVSQ